MTSLSDERKKQLSKLERIEEKERRARHLRLTYSPGEQIWVGISIATQLVLWAFILI